jgi:hypothetical protein
MSDRILAAHAEPKSAQYGEIPRRFVKAQSGKYDNKTRQITGIWSGSGWAPFTAPVK